MAMREYVMLASTLKAKEKPNTNYFWSPKLDGVRALWIPTMRGKVSSLFSGTTKVLTGLFTRYGKPIHAPASFLDGLPLYPLDGELLWMADDNIAEWKEPEQLRSIDKDILLTPTVGLTRVGVIRNLDSSFQKTISTVREHTPNLHKWKDITYFVFDSPTYEAIFQTGTVNNNIVKNHNLVREMFEQFMGQDLPGPKHFAARISSVVKLWLFCLAKESELRTIGSTTAPITFMPLPQFQVNNSQLLAYYGALLAAGFEGLIGRDPMTVWTPKRNRNVVKLKPFADDEGTIVAHNPGTGKYAGMLGSYAISWIGPGAPIKDAHGVTKTQPVCYRQFNLSGMDDEERNNPRPLGTRITFKYRVLTDDMVPREARIVRTREEY